jgi:Winged helix DNA-binding domain
MLTKILFCDYTGRGGEGSVSDARIAAERLERHRLTTPGSPHAADLVAWFGAIQAQDYGAAKWALALRMRGAVSDANIERAFNEGRILRTHVMRPTWHFVAPEDLRWLLALTAPRVHQASA